LYHWGESKKGSQKTLFLAINAKGGEKYSPKQKDRTTKDRTTKDRTTTNLKV
jgi:hypothetical protein